MADFYVWQDRGDGFRWWGCDKWGLHDYIIEPGWKIITTGTSISNATFKEIFRMIEEDPDFGKKQGFKRGERRPDEKVDKDR